MSDFIKQMVGDISLEAIAFQHDRLLLKELTAIMVSYRAKQLSLKQAKIALDEAMASHTNILVDITIEDDSDPNACVYLPALSPDHPFYHEYDKSIRKDHYDFFTKDGSELLKKKLNTVGWVDLNSGKVHGSFAKIPVRMYINTGLFDAVDFTEEEVSSVILHELGHAFTTFEYLADSIVVNFQLASLVKELTHQPSIPRRIEIINNAKAGMGINDVNAEEAAYASEAVLVTLLLNGKVNNLKYGSKAKSYSQTGCESVADQFTTRHGGGRAIVTALDKMHLKYGASFERRTEGQRLKDAIFHILIGVLSVVFAISGVFLLMVVGWMFFLGIIMTIFTDPSTGRYDREGDRYKRIRNDLVVALKNTKLSRTHREDILNDIKIIDGITGQMSPYFTVWEKLSLKIFSSHREELNQKQIEKELEYLASNDLFVKAAQFQTIG